MRNFHDSFEKHKRSFFSAFSIEMTTFNCKKGFNSLSKRFDKNNELL